MMKRSVPIVQKFFSINAGNLETPKVCSGRAGRNDVVFFVLI